MNKTTYYSLLLSTTLLLCACASSTTETTEKLEPSRLDVESFINGIDITQDISQLSLADCRILQNGFAARVGFPFRDAYLRGIFMTTTWYDSLQWAFDQDTALFDGNYQYDDNKNYRDNYYAGIKSNILNLTEEEQDFIDRLKAREEALRTHNFDVPEGMRVNLANLINPAQLVEFDPDLQQKLGEQGFAIVPADHLQLFHVYEQNDYSNMPSFVTTDLFLQLYHHYFDCLLRDIEEKKLYPQLSLFCQEAEKTLNRLIVVGDPSSQSTTPEESSSETAAQKSGASEKAAQKSGASETAATAGAMNPKEWLETYFKVANALLTAQAPEADATALLEYQRVMESEDAMSAYLGYVDAMFAYSLFRPRGHYTRNDTLQRYFRTMMWLQTVPFQTDKREEMERAFLLAQTIGGSPELSRLYKALTEPMTWLMGKPDDVSIQQVWELIQAAGLSGGSSLSRNSSGYGLSGGSDTFEALCQQIDEIAERQTRIRPKFLRTSRNKVRLMPQRYQPDAEVLQEMVDYDSEQTLRAVPEGLDILAAMGVSAAEELLLAEGQKWQGFSPMLKKMKARMDTIDWQETLATQWLSTLKRATETSEEAPHFMLTPDWDRKELNSALASWAELKHDAILYAKQPFGAECGGAGPPEPVVKGYVEPNVGFWQKAITLLDNTEELLQRYRLSTEKSRQATRSIKELAELFLRLSEKELKGELLSDEENDQLEYIGAAIENITLDLIREPDQYLMGWNDVQGPDRNTALVADVYTANADNNPDKSILYAAVGQADELYVVVEIGGYLYLMRGAVLSYREFTRPIHEQRLNDEQWQEYLKDHPREGVPAWMLPITVPLKKAPVPNDKFFYSTGC